VGLASRTSFASLSWGIQDTWPNQRGCWYRKVEVLNSLIMKIMAKENDVSDIFADISVTPATIITAFEIERQ